MRVISGAGTDYPSWAPEFTPIFSGVRVTRSLVLCVCLSFCSFVLFLLAIVLSVLLEFMDSDYPFGIFKLFLYDPLRKWHATKSEVKVHSKFCKTLYLPLKWSLVSKTACHIKLLWVTVAFCSQYKKVLIDLPSIIYFFQTGIRQYTRGCQMF